MSKNQIIAIITGCIEFKYEQCSVKTVKAGEMFMISRSAHGYGKCIEDTQMVILYFEIPVTNCEKINFQELKDIAVGLDSPFNVLPIRSPVDLFFSTLSMYLKVGASCLHLHHIKQVELLLILRYYYTKQELASLFYSMLYKSYEFRDLVLKNFEQVKSIKELVDLSHMSKSVFFEKFKEEFGMSAKQWLLKQTVQKLEYMALEPGMTVKELMLVFEFDTLSSFQRFCKHQIGCSPTELLNRSSNFKEEG